MSEEMVWIEGDEAKGCIVIPNNAMAPEVFAAEELQRYLREITGVEMPIQQGLSKRPEKAIILAVLDRPSVKSLLPSDLGEGLERDGYRWRAVEASLYIVSQETYGLVFGVYEYLRQLGGISFCDYAPAGEDIPSSETFGHQPLDVLRNPRFTHRSLQASNRYPKEDILSYLDWMAKNGFNRLLLHATIDPSVIPWEEVRKWLLPEMEKRGMELELGRHSFARFLNKATYFQEHPEYFALLDGKRGETEAQLAWCLSNPDLQEEVAKNLISYIEQNPEIRLFDFWPNDGVDPVCECESCRAFSTVEGASEEWKEHLYGAHFGARGTNPQKARAYLRFANIIAEKVAAVRPEARLRYLAYVDVTEPPPDDQPHPNLDFCVTMYWQCAKHALNDPDCFINEQYARALEAWTQRVGKERVYLYEYYMGMGCWRSLPYPTITTMFADWQWFEQIGICGSHIQSSPGHITVYGINYLAFARLAWDAQLTADQFLRDYCQSFFQEAADPMLAMYQLWEQGMQAAEHTQPSPFKYLHIIFPPESMQKWAQLMQAARGLAQSEKVRSRVERLDALRRYVELYLEARPFMAKLADKEKKEKLSPEEEKKWAAAQQALRAFAQEEQDLGLRIGLNPEKLW